MSDSVKLKPGLEPYPGYCLHQYLGGGAFGEVWEAVKNGSGRVALKFLYNTRGPAASREIRILQCVRDLKHPNLISLEQIWCYGGFVVYEMELAEGSLQDLLEAYQIEYGTAMPPEQVCLYLSQAAEGLDFLNARQHVIEGKRVGIQHCDVKPSNMLLLGDKVKLADFGLMARTSAPLQAHRRGGTADYMSAEQFLGQISNWSDQYALAVTYCQLRGGRLPFVEAPRQPAGYVRPEPDLSMLSPAERPIVARGLDRVPQDRWRSCSEMMRELTEQIS